MEVPVDDAFIKRVNALPFLERWTEGKKMLREAKKAGSKNGAREQTMKVLKEKGLYEDEREGSAQAGVNVSKLSPRDKIARGLKQNTS